MLDMSWGELLVIGGVALVVIGPKDLPKALRTVGNVMGKVRRMAGEFQTQFNDAMREADLEELRKSASDVSDAIKPFKSEFDPLKTARDEIKNAVQAPMTAPTETPVIVQPQLEVPAPSIAKRRRVKKSEQAGSVSQAAPATPKAAKAAAKKVSASEPIAATTSSARKKPTKISIPESNISTEVAPKKAAVKKPATKRSAAGKSVSKSDEKTS